MFRARRERLASRCREYRRIPCRLDGSNTIHHSAPGLGGDLLAAMAQLIERATAIGGSSDQDGLARAGVRVKNDLLGSDLDFRSLNAFLIEEIAWCRDAGCRARMGSIKI